MSNTVSYRIGSLKNRHLPFAQVAEMGIKGLELVWEPDTTAALVKAALGSCNLSVASIQVPCPLEDQNLPKTIGAQAAQAAELGARYLFVSAHAGEKMPKSEAYDRLRRVGDAVAVHQVFLAMETHPDLCQNGDQMAETMKGVNHPWVGVNYDTANIYYYNENVDTIAELNKVISHVRGVHLKDTFGGYRDGKFPVFGEGIVDFAAVGKALREGGYTGACAMELEGGTFDPSKPEDLAQKVARCVAHLKKVGFGG
ncbi:MAG: sugar phosphate isomerase/epimerase [Candidatus Handelsmanbacteria bacterium]|nr:sugar phosphate isomerase/epimerase [Candidatus Handelsmanbacteria bacterium]